ncbi:cell division protein FtsA [Clostridium sp. SYSU_GA19001]|uniref:cell division protein FtsA n=1 Tax=Clostridium caldaquaticum TaxID=2940653 RepID=UPI002076F120|nr:cell division protein FtsA [Clostridium caldaquaticum]MCM8710475.1 cell division protein FtsA [Clostridium caldaquaticum]
MDEYIVGIDIGSSKICAAVGRIDKQDKLQIVGITSVSCTGLKKGTVVNIDSTSESIKNCLEQLEEMIDIKITGAYVSLPGGICELVSSKGVVAISSQDREIRSNDIDRVLKAAKIISVPSNKEIIGVIPKQYIIDGYDNIKDPLGMSGIKLEVDAHIILAQTTIVSNLVKSVNKAGIEVNGIVLEPLAISEAALKKDEINMGTAVVDVGADKIDISIYKGGNILHTDMIPFGGNIITNDIAICLKIPFSEAEKIKIKYGSLEKLNGIQQAPIKVNSTYNNFINIEHSILVDIIEARVDELLKLIRVKLYESGYYENIAGIVIVGGGLSLFNGVCDLGRKIFERPVRIGAPEYVGASNPVYNTAVGIIKDVINTSSFNKINRNTRASSDANRTRKVINEKNQDINEKSVLSKIKGFLADFF